MGVPAFSSIRTNDLPLFVADLCKRGVTVRQCAEGVDSLPADIIYRCSNRHSSIEVWVDSSSGHEGESIVIVPYPPYQFAFWHWSSDSELFDCVSKSAEKFEYHP